MDRNSKCKFNGDALAFLYNELPAAQRFEFEDHLVNCHPCTDEFAGIADARLAVYEWNSLEFAHLETPEFHLPMAEVAADAANEVKVSWLDALKAFFNPSFNLGTATAGFAAVVIIGVFGLMLFNSGGNEQASSLTIAEQPSAKDALESIDNDIPEKSPVISNVVPNNEIAAETTSPTATQFEYINASDNNVRPVRRPARNTQRPNVQRISTRLEDMPTRLSNFEETQDDSLRLSELFDDSGIS